MCDDILFVMSETTPSAKSRKTSTSPATTEGTPATETAVDAAEAVESAKPAEAKPKAYAAVSGAEVDPIAYSRAVPVGSTGPRRSLTVYHVQRRLYELGFVEGWSETAYRQLTRNSVSAFQESRGENATGVLTRQQFQDLFKDDPNVSVLMDTVADNPIS